MTTASPTLAMPPVPVSAIRGPAEKAAVTGTLVSCGLPEQRKREDGEPYVLQTFTLSEDGVDMVGVGFDGPDLRPYIGKQIVLSSRKSRNGRVGGVSVFEAGGSFFSPAKRTLSIRLTRAAEVREVGATTTISGQ